MAFYRLYSHPLERSYHASICTKASLFQLISTVLFIVVPLLIAYRTQGFWLKTNTYKEQPRVKFLHRLIAFAHGGRTEGTGPLQVHQYTAFHWSTYPLLNEIASEHARPSRLRTFYDDLNRDGKMDTFHLDLHVPLADGEYINGLSLFLMFQYDLELYSRFRMQTLVYHTCEFSRPLTQLQLAGDMRLVQRSPLRYHGRDDRLNQPLINETNIDASEYLFENIMIRAAARNVSTELQHVLTMPKYGPTSITGGFHLAMRINIPLETVEYWTGFWELLKWGWIQYLAILVVFWYVVDKIQQFVYSNTLLTTVPKLDKYILQAHGEKL